MIPFSPMPVAAPPAQTTGQPAAGEVSVAKGNSFADKLATGDAPKDSGQQAAAEGSSDPDVTPDAEPLPATTPEPPEDAILFSDASVGIANIASTETAVPALASQPQANAVPAQGDTPKPAELRTTPIAIQVAQNPTPTDPDTQVAPPPPNVSLSGRLAPDVTQGRPLLNASATQPIIPSPENSATKNAPAQTVPTPPSLGQLVTEVPAPTPPVQKPAPAPPNPSPASVAQSPAITANIPPAALVVQAATPPPTPQPARVAIETANRTYAIATASSAKPIASPAITTPDVTPIMIADMNEPLSRIETVSANVERATTAQSTATTIATPDQARAVSQQLITVLPTTAPGTTEITLQPEELGRVRMTLTVQDGAMTLLIQADRPDTADLLRRNIDQLAQAYRQLGFDTLNFSFAGSAGEDASAAEAVVADQVMTAEETSEHATDVHQTPPPNASTTRLDLRI